MTNSTRNYLVTFSVLATILALICATYFSMDTSSIMIDGESVHGFAGVGIAAGGVMIGLLAVVFAIGITGVVLAGVSVFLVLLFAVIAGAILLAILPALLPILIVIAIVTLIVRKKSP